MRSSFIFPLISLCFFWFSAKAQLVYKASSSYDADVRVYVTKFKSEADLVVNIIDSKTEAKGRNNGNWCYTGYTTEADVKVYFTSSKNDADIIIYYADSRYSAGWEHEGKRSLMDTKRR